MAFYIRVVVVMFFSDRAEVAEGGQAAAVSFPSALTSAVIGIGVTATLVLGVVPGPFLDLLGKVGFFIR